jgi:hypothetical protein
MGKRATKQKATSYKKRNNQYRRKMNKAGEKLSAKLGGLTKAQQMAESANVARLLQPHKLALGKSITKKRAIKKVKALQSVALRKIGRQFPPTAIHTVLSMLR